MSSKTSFEKQTNKQTFQDYIGVRQTKVTNDLPIKKLALQDYYFKELESDRVVVIGLHHQKARGLIKSNFASSSSFYENLMPY